MKTSHHFLAVLLAVLLCLSLTACGDSSDDVTGDDWRTSGVVAAEGTITHEGEGSVKVLVTVGPESAAFYRDEPEQELFDSVSFPVTVEDANDDGTGFDISFDDITGDGESDVVVTFQHADMSTTQMVWFWDADERYVFEPDYSCFHENGVQNDLTDTPYFSDNGLQINAAVNTGTYLLENGVACYSGLGDGYERNDCYWEVIKHSDPVTAGGTTPSAALATDVASEDERFISDSPRFVKGFMLLLLAVGIGNQVSVWLTALTGLTFPAYIGAMLVAVVVRNAMDGVHTEYPAEEIATMGNMFLSIFLAMALAGLKLWELIDLALPMIVCLVLQCIVMFLFSYFVVFNVMGHGYDAAVMTAGFIGFAMGATSNAMANMQVVTKKYGPSPVAYFAIPMVGGMFIDFFNAVLISANISWWA